MPKYADCPTTQCQTTISAEAADVWPLLCDINLPAQFSAEFQRAEWETDGPALGAAFRGYNKHKAVGEWNVPCTVTAFEPERVFEWTVGGLDNKAARWRFELDPQGNQSVLTFSAEMGPGPSGLTPAIEAMPEREEDIVARRLSEWTANMERTIEGIKGIAEANTSATEASAQ